MKTAQEIAQVLLNRRNTMNPVVMQGEMLLALESEGLQEALQRRWLVPQMDTGFLMVSQDQSKVLEMREMAEHCGHCPEDLAKEKKEGEDKEDDKKKDEWTKPWEHPNESHQFAVNHSERNISELLSPGTGHDSGSPLSSAPPAPTPTGRVAPPPAVPPTAAMPSASSRPPSAPNVDAVRSGQAPGKPGIGSMVSVPPTAESQQTYTGKVTKSANGMVTVAFGNTEREFPESEVKLVAA
jgi:hypothetical protein